MNQQEMDAIAELIAEHTESYEVSTFDCPSDSALGPPKTETVHRIERGPFVEAMADLFSKSFVEIPETFGRAGSAKSVEGVRVDRDSFIAKTDGRDRCSEI